MDCGESAARVSAPGAAPCAAPCAAPPAAEGLSVGCLLMGCLVSGLWAPRSGREWAGAGAQCGEQREHVVGYIAPGELRSRNGAGHRADGVQEHHALVGS